MAASPLAGRVDAAGAGDTLGKQCRARCCRRWRVQDAATHQRLPARFSSISSSVGASILERSRLYMLITKPGVQKPHWLPCARASRSCTGCRPARPLPMPARAGSQKFIKSAS